MPILDSTQRFSSRVNDYVRFRPSYPKEIIGILERECGLNEKSVIADIASGTGLFTKLLLEHGNPVFAVEPKPRDAARRGRIPEKLWEFR